MKIYDQDFPADELGHLAVAFNMLGKYKFGSRWPRNMAHRVRLGCGLQSKSRIDSDSPGDMGGWTIRALIQCVENGWLPLVYFINGRRIWYYSNENGPSLHWLYPRPTDDDDEGGQIELIDGSIFPCMVYLGNFDEILKSKFANRLQAARGPERKFINFDIQLDKIFMSIPIDTASKEIIRLLDQSSQSDFPKRTTMYARIDDARERARMRIRSLKTPE